MPGDIKESDWKIFKQVHSAAHERFCERIISEIDGIRQDKSKRAEERYAAINELLRQRNKQLANAFNDFRRSTAFRQLGIMFSYGLLLDEELSRFSPEMQERIRSLYEKRGLA